MTINENLALRGTSQNSRPVSAVRAGKGSQPQGSCQSGEDRVELSDRARALAMANEAMDVTPQIQADKVILLKESIQNGTYQVSAEEIASRMLGDGFLA